MDNVAGLIRTTSFKGCSYAMKLPSHRSMSIYKVAWPTSCLSVTGTMVVTGSSLDARTIMKQGVKIAPS